jgi:hypothetical protein
MRKNLTAMMDRAMRLIRDKAEAVSTQHDGNPVNQSLPYPS